MNPPIVIATRGSALALAQAHAVLDQCRRACPGIQFELKIIKTTGDKLQTASLANAGVDLPKGLFTKELEVALLEGQADLAVHSLKDLPTELPPGLELGAIGKRADVRDVLVYRDASRFGDAGPVAAGKKGFAPLMKLDAFPRGMVVATSSTRRRAQLLAVRPEFQVVEIRGNVGTRLCKLSEQPQIDATILAAAGLERLNFHLDQEGRLSGDGVPEGLLASVLDPAVMLPCVGQGALGIETRVGDERIAEVCARLNDFETQVAVTAERAFLRAMGGGCQSPVAAYGEVVSGRLNLRVVSFTDGKVRRAEQSGPLEEAARLGAAAAEQVKR